MSNGLTSVFVSVLVLAASELAETNRQREFAAWFASHDQGVFGLGIVGFDACELPWSLDTFSRDRKFVLRAIDAAKAKTGWERLGYEPQEEVLQPCLEQFRMLMKAFSIEHAAETEDDVWPYGRPTQLLVCPIHQAYKHEDGCVLCNDR